MKGFTLLETITSAAILALVVIGPLAVITSSSVYAKQTKDMITATYLAEETMELLQNQYDSVYIFCKNNSTDPICTPLSDSETSGQVSWRVFKNRMSAVSGQPSCYLSDNPNGCSYDTLSMMGSVTVIPTRYTSNDPRCQYLIDVATTTGLLVSNNNAGAAGGTNPNLAPGLSTPNTMMLRHMYVCNGVTSGIPSGSKVTPNKFYARSVTIESMPTFDTGPTLLQYNDDLRITTVVNFKGVNGVTRTVKVIRFMHASA